MVMSSLGQFSPDMIPLPLTSTLFPYTTLFRSSAVIVRHRGVVYGVDRDADCRRVAAAIAVADRVREAVRPVRIRVDRKSTRLNSSHSQISYAVFCLNKKRVDAHVSACRDSIAF